MRSPVGFLVVPLLCAAFACDAPDPFEDPAPGQEDAVDSPRFQAFLQARQGYLERLSLPIRACVARRDNAEPLFHGCFDWHSAVHGTWALLALTRLTGDPDYTAAADAALDPALVASELTRLRDMGISAEVPYGYAWFLRLARERAAAGKSDLVPLAVEVAADLEAYLLGRSPAQIEAGVRAPDYANLSWPALNLYQYAVSVGDTTRAATVVDFAREKLWGWDETCALTLDTTQTSQFFPPCLHRTLALLTMLPPDEAGAWLKGFVPAGFTLTPLTAPSTVHSAGLDFSRAWGLWALWRATRDLHYLEMYLDHVETWMAVPQYWAEDYVSYAHWVPQFGVYALAQSYGEP